MENINVGKKKLSKYEIQKYRQEYGIELLQKGQKVNLTGGIEELNIVCAKIRKEVFLSENQNVNHENVKEGGISENIENVMYETDFSKIRFSMFADYCNL